MFLAVFVSETLAYIVQAGIKCTTQGEMTLHPAYTPRECWDPGPPLLLRFMLLVLRLESRVPCTQGIVPTNLRSNLVWAFVLARFSAQKPPTDVSSGSVGKHWVPCLYLDPSPQWQLMGCHDYEASPCLVGQEMSVGGMQGETGVG